MLQKTACLRRRVDDLFQILHNIHRCPMDLQPGLLTMNVSRLFVWIAIVLSIAYLDLGIYSAFAQEVDSKNPLVVQLPKQLRFSYDLRRDLAGKTQEYTIDLGRQLCNESLSVEVRMKNGTDVSWKAPRITSSCGCISGLPSNLGTEPESESVLSFKIKLPKASEKLGRQIVFWDGTGNALLQMTITSDVVLPFSPTSQAIDLANDCKQSFSIPLTQSIKGVSCDGLSASVYGAGVTNAKLDLSSESPVVHVDMDTLVADGQLTHIPLSLELSRDGKEVGSAPLTVRVLSRNVFFPKTISFQRNGSDYTASFKLSSVGFMQALEAKGQLEIIGIAEEITKKVKLSVNQTKQSPQLSTFLIEVRVSDLEISDLQSLKLSCGDWSTTVECNVRKLP